MSSIQFTLNGNPLTVPDSDQSLLQYLRQTACLRGTKNGCGTGHCGACTVLIDGRPRRACLTKLAQVRDKHVETIEGLAEAGTLHPIQRAFLDAGAVQCGFCSPGMVLATKALLDKNPDPSRAEIFRALRSNYCRCTGYVKIIEAVLLAAARMRGEDPDLADIRVLESTWIVKGSFAKDLPEVPTSIVGRSLWDADGEAKVRGSLQFCDDIEIPGLLHGAYVWAPAPRGRIVSRDYTAASKMPGVLRVIDYRDVVGENAFGTFGREQAVYCEEEFFFLGDMLAMVVAETEEQARAAAAAVKIDFEALPGIFTIDDGREQGAILGQSNRVIGDLEVGRQQSAVTVSGDFTIERVEHGCLEPESAIGWGQGNELTLYATTQSPFEIRRMLSFITKLPEDRLRVIATPLGGGFGSKCDAHIEAGVAVAGQVMQQPVRVTLTREESFLISTKRHAFQTSYEMGFSSDGRIQFLDARMFSDAGPYDNLSTGVLMQACIFSGGPYVIPNAHVAGRAIRTNNVLGGAFRGFGINQAAISVESMLDEAAIKLGLDPFEIRRINALRIGSSTVGGEILRHSVGILDTIDLCEKHTKMAVAEYEGRYPDGDKVFGVGVASGFKNVGVGKGVRDDGGCILTKYPNGRILMRVSGVDMGQGFRTAMLQLVAEALECDPQQIDILSSDTSRTLYHGQAVGERQTLNTGRAVVEAAARLREKLSTVSEIPEAGITAEFAFSAPRTYGLDDDEGRQAAGENYRNYPSYAYTTQAALIELDRKTGIVKVLKVIAAHDTGRVINPQICEGQIQGSCSMGIGYALTESFPSETGVPLKQNYGSLGMARIDDTPLYEIILTEDPEPLGPYGAKGISEVATVPMTPAVLNAINNAIGRRVHQVPATPEVILGLLNQD